MPDVAHSWGI